jgi:hypothetical protein
MCSLPRCVVWVALGDRQIIVDRRARQRDEPSVDSRMRAAASRATLAA